MKIFIIISLLIFSKLYSQEKKTNSLKVLNSINDDKYKIELIPENAFSGDFDLLVIPNITDKKNSDNIIPILWANHVFDDKRYKLVINPRQIYLRTVSNTPNSKSLLWKSNISHNQFLKIKNHIRENKKDNTIVEYEINENNKITYFFKNNKSGEDISQLKSSTELDRTYTNLKQLISLINKSFDYHENKIYVPAKNDFKKIKSIRIIHHIDDLDIEMTPLKRVEK